MPDLTVAQAAEAAGVSERTMRRWIRDGRLAGCYKVGGRVRIPERAIRDAAEPYGESNLDGRTTASVARLAGQGSGVHSFAARGSPSRTYRSHPGQDEAAGRGPDDTAEAYIRQGRDEQDAKWDRLLGLGARMILDASVAAKWFLSRRGSDRSRPALSGRRMLDRSRRHLQRPSSLWSEVGECGGPCDAARPDRLLNARISYRRPSCPRCEPLIATRSMSSEWTWRTSSAPPCRSGISAYDAQYLAAGRSDADSSVLTADRRMLERGQRARVRCRLAWRCHAPGRRAGRYPPGVSGMKV